MNCTIRAVIVLLFLAAAIGGGLNAVAGGGSFLTLPALIFAGVSPVVANATSTLALWPASISSTVAYRSDIKTSGRWLLILGATSVVGGLAGAVLLVRTSDSSFLRLLPWLMLIAAVTFTFGQKLRPKRLRSQSIRLEHGTSSEQPPMLGIVVIQLVIAAYGGYFGGGMGIMMLATFALAGMTNIHEMNGLKALLGVSINGLALLTFVLNGAIRWNYGLTMAVGGVVGGYSVAALARKLDSRYVRAFVIAVGWSMTLYFFLPPAVRAQLGQNLLHAIARTQ
jgi:uncharacterized membrane protein YfcA